MSYCFLSQYFYFGILTKTMNKLIGISGKMQAGKDTTALMIAWLLEYSQYHDFDVLTYASYSRFDIPSWVRYSIYKFADYLKECVSAITGFPRNSLESKFVKDQQLEWLNNITVRELMQKFGEAGRDKIMPDFWIRCTLRNYSPDKLMIISDVRYQNEVKAIKDLGGIIIRINRPNSPKSNHISEIDLDNYDDWDYVIDNSGTLEDLFNKCKDLCISLGLSK